MRELTFNETSKINGALNFTDAVTPALLNQVPAALGVAGAVYSSFSLGYAVGTWLNNTFGLSTRIVDAMSN